MAYHSIAFLLVAQPSFEKFQCPKAPDAVWMAICAAVGYKTLDGSLNKWVPTAISVSYTHLTLPTILLV